MQRVVLAVLLAVFAASIAGAGMQTPTRIERTPTVLNLPFSGSVKAGGLIYVSGTLATDANKRIVAGDIKAQTKQTLENIKAELARHGTTLDRCAAVMVSLKRRSDFAAMNEVYATFFPNDPPTRTTIVADLLRLPPLRTVRATFTVYRKHLKGVPGRGDLSAHSCADFTIPTGGNPTFPLMGAPAGYSLPSSAFPYEGCLSGFLVTRHLLEVCSFSRRGNAEPVSTPLQRRPPSGGVTARSPGVRLVNADQKREGKGISG